jgi:hypothetical protein
MKLPILGGVLVCAAAVCAAQTASKPSSTVRARQKMTLSGCVTAGTTAADPFTLTVPETAGNPTVPTPGAPPAVGALPPLGTTGTRGAEVNSDATPARGYRLSGTNMKPYVGKRVRIVGGFVPSPNAAATAGAASSGVVPPTGVDGAINSATTPNTTGVVALPEFNVVTVRAMPGACRPR